mmetsp:Transcript_20211/g.51626  ORF Transcript_20211/g.51626 Transcript_20211/m.51626 type:complete len:97 (+) Transcript_20211:1173-1463(+)
MLCAFIDFCLRSSENHSLSLFIFTSLFSRSCLLHFFPAKHLLKALTCRIQEKGNTALHIAASLGHDDIANYLLKKGADGTIQNGKGKTYDRMKKKK